MKNIITCKNCRQENPFFSFICSNCNSYLRERIVNIDLWNTIGLMIETPGKAFNRIILAEHKNFIFFLIFLIGIKLFINSLIILEPFAMLVGGLSFSPFSIFIFDLILPLIHISVFAYLIQILTQKFHLQTRFKDNFSTLIYALIPNVFALIFLFPVEIVLFGGYLFSANPSPFEIKPTPALILFIMEILMILWSVLLAYFAVLTTTKSRIFSFITGFVFVITFAAIPVVVILFG